MRRKAYLSRKNYQSSDIQLCTEMELHYSLWVVHKFPKYWIVFALIELSWK